MIAEVQAQVDIASADVKAAELAVDWCTIRSPIDGVVVQLSARQGQFIDRAVTLATVTDLSEMFAKFQIPSDVLANCPSERRWKFASRHSRGKPLPAKSRAAAEKPIR